METENIRSARHACENNTAVSVLDSSWTEQHVRRWEAMNTAVTSHVHTHSLVGQQPKTPTAKSSAAITACLSRAFVLMAQYDELYLAKRDITAAIAIDPNEMECSESHVSYSGQVTVRTLDSSNSQVMDDVDLI